MKLCSNRRCLCALPPMARFCPKCGAAVEQQRSGLPFAAIVVAALTLFAFGSMLVHRTRHAQPRPEIYLNEFDKIGRHLR